MDKVIELLSNTQQANLVMQNIASYVTYIYPGIISIYLYNFFAARTTKDTQAFVIKSFAISYLYNLILQSLLANICFLKETPDKNSIAYNVFLIVAAFIIPYFCYKLKLSHFFSLICEKLGISTSVTDVPFELLEDKEEEYTCLKIYLKDEPCIYVGYLSEYEYEDGHEKYVILTGYRKYSIGNKNVEKLEEGHGINEYNEKVFIKFNDIKRVEKIGEKRAKEKIYKEIQN